MGLLKYIQFQDYDGGKRLIEELVLKVRPKNGLEVGGDPVEAHFIERSAMPHSLGTVSVTLKLGELHAGSKYGLPSGCFCFSNDFGDPQTMVYQEMIREMAMERGILQ